MSKHPVQPLFTDEHGTVRFKQNNIVVHLLENGSLDLNYLAGIDFPAEDRQQFAQLIGYSLGGYGDLSYVDDKAWKAANKKAKKK